MLLDSDFDPFAARTLVDIPDLTDDTSTTWSGFRFEAEPRNELLKLAKSPRFEFPDCRPDVLKLDIADVPFVGLEPITQPSSETSDHEDVYTKEGSTSEEAEEDFWKTPDLLLENKENKLVSWDCFVNTQHQEPVGRFLSEAGPRAFDLVLRKCLADSHNEYIKYAKPDVLLDALLDLSLGRSSAIFSWNEQSQRFDTTTENYTTSGLSSGLLRNVVDQFLDAGTQFRKLRTFGQSHSQRSSTRIALQTVANSAADAIEEIVESQRSSVKSIIQVREITYRAFELLIVFDRLAREIRSTQDDADLVSAVISFADTCSLERPEFERIMHLIVSRMLQPILCRVEQDLGIVVKNEVSQINVGTIIPRLASPSLVETFAQAEKTLHIIQVSGHGFLAASQQASRIPLSVGFSLEAISEFQAKANDYERQVREFVMAHRTSGLGQPQTIDLREPQGGIHVVENPFSFDWNVFDPISILESEPSVFDGSEHETLQQAIAAMLSTDIEVSVGTVLSSRQAMELSLGPMLRAQHRLLSYAALRSLLQDHNLVLHVASLGRFQLLRDGTFTSKLSLALFDSDQLSGEGRLVAPTRTGLRLQSRQTWPPATSELRLALMGILAESLPAGENDGLGDAISFAIRDLADEDLERCRDIDSIYALDFLRLNYKPPNLYLEAVVSQQSLDRYDNVFNQLLRLLRMKALAQSILRKGSASARASVDDHGHKFKVEIQQFVTALGEYCQNVVIETAWHTLGDKLAYIQSRIDEGNYDGTLGSLGGGGLEQLRQLHDQTLDKICSGLFLKRKQSQAKGLIDRLFEVILRFAAFSNFSAKGNSTEGSSTEVGENKYKQLHADFTAHMRDLVRWLNTTTSTSSSSSTSAGSGSNSGSGGNYGFEQQLLLKLDWNGYWSR